MRFRLHAILFLFLASVFCFREMAPLKALNSDYSCCLEDFSEDDSSSPTDNDEENESDLLFSGFLSHQFTPAATLQTRYQSFSLLFSKSPYFEIHLPPPELFRA